jgi:LysR family transcriptional regulator for bpeEF and oprC
LTKSLESSHLDSLYAISIFVRVAEAKSFTKAAQHLGISASGVSKSMTRLEERLGVRLLNRTTRSVSLTDDGLTFFERCRLILGELEDAETTVTGGQTKLRGRLRIQLPVGFGLKILVPLLAQFNKLYSELVLDAEFSDRVADLAEEGIDAIVRVGQLDDSRLVARQLYAIRYVTVASPSYLARHGEPITPEDLQRHQCLGFYIPQTHGYRNWDFVVEGQRSPRLVSGHLNMNSGQALLNAAIAGAGIASLATYMAYEAVKSGQLRIVLREYSPAASVPIWIGYLERRHLSFRIRAFVDFLVNHIPPPSSWDAILEKETR